MPLLAGLALALDAACVVHALRARQPYYWFLIIFSLPGIGAGIYFFSEILPDIAHSRAAREAASDLGQVIDPAKQIRDATAALRLSDTAENRKILAEALLADNRYDEARTLYETALEGAHADDPALMMGLARSCFGLKDYQSVCDTLDRLREANPDFQSSEAHLLYARSREGMGDLDQAALSTNRLPAISPAKRRAADMACCCSVWARSTRPESSLRRSSPRSKPRRRPISAPSATGIRSPRAIWRGKAGAGYRRRL